MFARTETCSGSFREPCRWLRVGGLAGVVAAGLVAAGLAGASPASADVKVVHSAKGGELKSGRLVLRGVSGRVAYATSGGSSGTASARRLHRRVFLPGKPATGTLRVAGQRGDGSKFRLSKPRYNAARRTVSYRAKPLAKKRSSGSSACAAGGAINPRPFGAASLSIAPHPTLASGDNGGNNCYATINVGEFTYGDFNLASSSNWDTDSWANSPPVQVPTFGYDEVESDGGLFRGCHWEAVYSLGAVPPGPQDTTVSMSVTWPWKQGPSFSCSSTDGWVKCWPYVEDGSTHYLINAYPPGSSN